MFRASHIALATACILAISCAGIRFERGPYAIRQLEVVYSAQEDVTFFSWRLRKDALLKRVRFEMWRGGEFLPISLQDTLFPAEPWQCGDDWCFQYQVPGEYRTPTSGSSLRSIHDDDGVFMGPEERVLRVESTFDIEPIGLGHNEQIDPIRFDWFADNEVPLRRSYQWQFTGWDDECAPPTESDWVEMTEPVLVDRAWTDRAVAASGICFAARPDRQDAPGAERVKFMRPSAETTWETQAYTPQQDEAPIVWGLLLDLEIPNDSRCSQVKGRLIDMIEQSIAAQGQNVKLGIYTPTDPMTGDELGGCDQNPERDYPLERMLRDAATAKAEAQPEDVRVLWVFANNIELPPSQRILDQLELFGLALLFAEGRDVAGEGGIPIPDDENVPVDLLEDSTRAYTWAIGSNVFMDLFPWDVTTPWRPVEDETLLADIRSTTKNTLPFATMRHTDSTEVDIQPPKDRDGRPLHLKVCDATPDPVAAIGTGAANVLYGPQEVVPWPEFDDRLPYYLVYLESQILVPRTAYVRRRQEIVVEVCTAFCDGPFRTRGGEIFTDWRGVGACQWQQ